MIARRDFLGIACTAVAGLGFAAIDRTAIQFLGRRVVYPRPLRPGDTIGITSPSAGIGPSLEPRLQFCLKKLRDLGYAIREGRCLRSEKIVSAPASVRAKELRDMLLDPSIAAIMPPWGGELLIDILPLLDFDMLARATPKWIVGYSDLCTLMLPFTLCTHIATLHGSNLLEAPIDPTDEALAYWNDVLRLCPGETFIQHAASLYQDEDVDWVKTPYATSFNRTKPVKWKCLKHENKPDYFVRASGRLIGGTLDVIGMLVGTQYGKLDAFVRACAPEGLILYFDNCDFNTAQYARMLHHLKLAGWFCHANAILIGRTAGEQLREFTQRDALVDALADVNVPILYDVDVGHLPPQLILVNGALASITFGPNVRSISQTLG